MAIETKDEWDRARAALEKRTPEALTAFILSLVDAPNGIANRVHVFAAADPKATAALLSREISFLRRGERDYDVRHRQSSEWALRIDCAVDAIESDLLPRDGHAALELLTLLVENETAISEHCRDDSFDAATAFERARKLLDIAARRRAP
jgi:hypothetical protein